MMRVAVIGGSGFIGRHTVHRLVDAHMDVLSIDRSTPSSTLGEQTIIADVSNTAEVERVAIESGTLDAVVWLAASIRHISIVDERALEDNVVMVEAPLRFLRTLSTAPSALVYMSSIQVYGKPEYLPIDEGHPTNPFRTYGVSKLLAEHMLAIASLKRGIAASFHRVAFAYGPGQHTNDALSRFIEKAKQGSPPTVFGNGTDKRDDIYVADIARAVELAILSRARGTFNIASGQCHTILDVAKEVCALSSERLEPTIDDTPSTWIDRCFTNEKAREAFDFEAQTKFSDGVRRMWDAAGIV